MIKHDYYLQQLSCGSTPSIALPEKHPPEVFCKKKFLEISQNSQENTCARASSLMKLQDDLQFIKKEALIQVFYCGICEISKNTFFTEHL